MSIRGTFHIILFLKKKIVKGLFLNEVLNFFWYYINFRFNKIFAFIKMSSQYPIWELAQPSVT